MIEKIIVVFQAGASEGFISRFIEIRWHLNPTIKYIHK